MLRDAVFAETLARLAEAKGAASAIRARLAWDSYRLRNLAAPSWGERTLLSGYRLLGYGELPWVAFATYAVLSGLLATLELRAGGPDLSIDGVERFVESTLFWLAAPLHLFNLASGELRQAFPEPAQTLAKLVVTVPFGTGVFALRKYVKAPT